jgi:hypothetical protein
VLFKCTKHSLIHFVPEVTHGIVYFLHLQAVELLNVSN